MWESIGALWMFMTRPAAQVLLPPLSLQFLAATSSSMKDHILVLVPSPWELL